MSKHTAIWAAGLFEGEGWVHVRRQWRDNGKTSDRFSLMVGVTNTDLLLIDPLRAEWGGTIRPKRGTALSRKPLFEWGIYGQQAAAFLRDIHPHMKGSRRAKVEKAINFQSLFCMATRSRDQRGRISRLDSSETERRESLRLEVNNA